jgi:transposase
MDQRIQFIGDYQRGLLPVTEVAERFGISRKTAYKWIDRYADRAESNVSAVGANRL